MSALHALLGAAALSVSASAFAAETNPARPIRLRKVVADALADPDFETTMASSSSRCRRPRHWASSAWAFTSSSS